MTGEALMDLLLGVLYIPDRSCLSFGISIVKLISDDSKPGLEIYIV